MHIAFLFIVITKFLLQNYDKVSINSSECMHHLKSCKMCKIFHLFHYSVSVAFSRVPSHKNHINFVVDHRLIKKGVNK